MPYKDPEVRRASKTAYYQANKEKSLQQNKTRYARNKAKYLAQQKVYRQRNRERLLALKRFSGKAYRAKNPAYSATYYQANKEKASQQNKARYERTKDERRVKQKAYRAAHPEEHAAANAVYRARKLAAPVYNLTAAQWREIKAAYGHRCVYCQRKMKRLTQDHIIPLSKGGEHTVSNVVPACVSCNAKKGAGAPPVPVQPLLLTIA